MILKQMPQNFIYSCRLLMQNTPILKVLLPGITIDSNFTFEKHIDELSKKENLKLHALTR